MKYRKMWAAASMTAEGLIVTGGWNGRSLFHTEIFSEGSWKIGPSLPVRLGATVKLVQRLVSLWQV